MGDFDFVPSVLERAGVKLLFSRINVQPGKPTTFGFIRKHLCLVCREIRFHHLFSLSCLSGHLLCKMMGYEWKPVILNLPMAEFVFKEISRQKSPGFLLQLQRDGFVIPVEYHGSAHISAFSKAKGIITFDEGKKSVEKGEIVSVRQI